MLTEDGLETTFAVNYLAPFLLTNCLLDVMKRSAPSRIINVASVAHWNGKLDWSNLQGERRYDEFDAYARSKLALILFNYALARRLEGSNVTANCLHPGVIKTKLLRAGFGDYPGDTPEKGAKTSVYLACSSEGPTTVVAALSPPCTITQTTARQHWYLAQCPSYGDPFIDDEEPAFASPAQHTVLAASFTRAERCMP
jgi:NAD(P)-dependent dehydrogenase (short-subunit alcohol dehydrogenase family)